MLLTLANNYFIIIGFLKNGLRRKIDEQWSSLNKIIFNIFLTLTKISIIIIGFLKMAGRDKD